MSSPTQQEAPVGSPVKQSEAAHDTLTLQAAVASSSPTQAEVVSDNAPIEVVRLAFLALEWEILEPLTELTNRIKDDADANSVYAES